MVTTGLLLRPFRGVYRRVIEDGDTTTESRSDRTSDPFSRLCQKSEESEESEDPTGDIVSQKRESEKDLLTDLTDLTSDRDGRTSQKPRQNAGDVLRNVHPETIGVADLASILGLPTFETERQLRTLRDGGQAQKHGGNGGVPVTWGWAGG
jgi:hypothetical protein